MSVVSSPTPYAGSSVDHIRSPSSDEGRARKIKGIYEGISGVRLRGRLQAAKKVDSILYPSQPPPNDLERGLLSYDHKSGEISGDDELSDSELKRISDLKKRCLASHVDPTMSLSYSHLAMKQKQCGNPASSLVPKKPETDLQIGNGGRRVPVRILKK